MSLQVGGFYHEEQFTKNFIFTAMRCDAAFSSTHDGAAEEETDMYITELKVNHLVEPIGIDIVPNFRWINNMSGYEDFYGERLTIPRWDDIADTYRVAR